MSEPFRVAFVGVDHPHGAGWRDTIDQLPGEMELVALTPGFSGAQASLAERHAHLPRYESIERLLEFGRFDGAIVCLPNDESPQALARLAEAGKHIMVEKPGAKSAAEFRQVAEIARRRNVAFQAGYLWRYDPGANRLREMVTEGRFGKLTSVEMKFVTSDIARRGSGHYLFDPAKSGRGYFNWLACHWLNLLPYVTGERVVAVTARVGVFGPTPSEMEDGGMALLDMEGGALALFVGGYWLPRWVGESAWSVRGADRWVHWDAAKAGGVFEIHGPQPHWQAMDETFELPADKSPGYGGAKGAACLRDWIAQARAASPTERPCRNTPESNLATLTLLDAIYESSSTERRVELAGG